MDRGAWQAIVHGVTKSQRQLMVTKHASIHTHTHTHTIMKMLPLIPCFYTGAPMVKATVIPQIGENSLDSFFP